MVVEESLERLYKHVQRCQVRCAGVIEKSEVVDLRSHQIGMFSAYSEMLNLLDEEIARKKL